MDMVSFETKAEETFVHNLMKSSGIKDVHTSGRLCDGEVEGCDQPRFQPLHINGWFWASSLKMMPPTNQVSNRFVSNYISLVKRIWALIGIKITHIKCIIKINMKHLFFLFYDSIITGVLLAQLVEDNLMVPSNQMGGVTKHVWLFLTTNITMVSSGMMSPVITDVFWSVKTYRYRTLIL